MIAGPHRIEAPRVSASHTISAAPLPLEHSSFVDRAAQLKAARAALGGTRLLTVVGTGGVGKTRFAMRLASSVRRLFPDGVWFTDLGTVTTADSVAEELARVIDVGSAHRDPRAALTNYFASRRGLLLLDNCEHVLDEVARLVLALLDHSPGLTVLATSRAPLRISAERVFELPPLATFAPESGPASPATVLFLDRCVAVLPDPTADEREDIARICERLDGLPLAIELAASRVKVLAPAQVRDRLAQPLAFLTRGARDAPDRQRTLRETIAWSYSLCTPAERLLWTRMSVFVGGWDLESAEWMSAGAIGDEATLDVVQSLIEKSIVTRTRHADGMRFGMLETVRLFGVETMPTTELDAARKRQRDWCLNRLALVEADWYGPHQAGWMLYLHRELPNIRAALEFCIADGDAQSAARLIVTAWRVVWNAYGQMQELRRWCSRVIELDPAPTAEVAQVMTLSGGIELSQGNAAAGGRLLDRAAELADRLGDPFSRAFDLFIRGALERDPDRSLELFKEALARQGGANLIPARATSEERVAMAYDLAGQTETAERMREALIARAARLGEAFETAQLVQSAGRIAARRGDAATATGLLEYALRLLTDFRAPVAVAQIEEALAMTAAIDQNFARAATLLGVSHSISSEEGATSTTVPLDMTFRSDIEERTRQRLGSQAYAAAFATGKSMTAAEGVAYALGAQPVPARTRAQAPTQSNEQLTRREGEVATLVAQGLSDREIADRLIISRRTAEGHVAHILVKLGFTSRSQIATWVAQRSLSSGG